MAVSKILLYYAFAPLPDPEAFGCGSAICANPLDFAAASSCQSHGFNGLPLAASSKRSKIYRSKTREYPAFRDIDFKWSEGTGLDSDGKSLDFPRLSVKVRDEIVSFGAPDDVEVGVNGVIGGGIHLKPEELHQLVEERGDEVVFFDGRNAWEAALAVLRSDYSRCAHQSQLHCRNRIRQVRRY